MACSTSSEPASEGSRESEPAARSVIELPPGAIASILFQGITLNRFRDYKPLIVKGLSKSTSLALAASLPAFESLRVLAGGLVPAVAGEAEEPGGPGLVLGDSVAEGEQVGEV